MLLILVDPQLCQNSLTWKVEWTVWCPTYLSSDHMDIPGFYRDVGALSNYSTTKCSSPQSGVRETTCSHPLGSGTLEGYRNQLALSRVLSLDVTSSLLIPVGSHTQILILHVDWSKITIAGLWRIAKYCATPYALKMPQFAQIIPSAIPSYDKWHFCEGNDIIIFLLWLRNLIT